MPVENNNIPKISIIIPIYNVEKELDRCVKSVLKQTYYNIEIILVDDGSPDKCPEMCDEYASLDNRVVVIHKENGGLSDARNYGLKEATGDYILYVDSDDYLESDACEKLISVASENVDFVVGSLREHRGGKTFYQRHSNIIEGKIYTSKEFIISSIQKNEFWAPAVLNLYSRRFLINNKLFYKKGCYFEDVEMLPRLFLAASQIVYLDYPFYNYIIRDGSIMTSSNSDAKRESILEIYKSWLKMIQNISDVELKRYMYGALVKLYLYSARTLKVSGWRLEGLNAEMAIKYALNMKEKVKVIAFTVLPDLYIQL